MSDHIVKAKLLALPSQCAALAGPQDVAPLALIHQGLKIHTTEFTVAEQHDPSPLGNQLPHLVHQLDVHSLRQVALSSLGYSPHDGQASLLIDQADHERHAATANDASVDYQHQWDVAQTQEQRSSKREEEGLALHRFIAKPSFESFDTSLDFRCLTSWPSRNLVGNVGKIRPPADHDTTDQPRRVFRRLARCPVGSAGNNVLKELRMASNLFCCHYYQAPFSAVFRVLAFLIWAVKKKAKTLGFSLRYDWEYVMEKHPKNERIPR